MRKSPLLTVLLIVLLVSALTSLGLCWGFISKTRQLQRLQSQAGIAQNQLTVFNSLANDVAEYSKTHPAIDPLLESVGIKMNRTGSTTSAPTTKPATK
jgi:hypothetical protein